MRSLIRVIGIWLLVLHGAEGRAGWLFETREAVLESYRNESQCIALTTLHDVRQLSQEDVERFYGTGQGSDRPAFAFEMKFHEVLRGAPAKKPLIIPFAFIPVSEDLFRPRTNEQREADLEGGRAVVIVQQRGEGERPVVIVLPVTSFEKDDNVAFFRKATSIWNITDLVERRKALQIGCRDPLATYQDYCCRRLANWSGGKPDQNAAEQLERQAAYPVIWERFHDPKVPLDVLATCDDILGRISPGWRTHPRRYEVLAAALQRHSQMAAPPGDAQLDSNLFVEKITALSRVPDRERETYRLLRQIIESAPKRYGLLTLSQLGALYRPHSSDADQQQLNREIWDWLVAGLEKPDIGPSAALALCDIARDYAYVGSVPGRVSQVLAAPPQKLPDAIAAEIGSRFDHFRSKVPEIGAAATLVEQRRKEGYVNLTVPGRSQIGKNVVFVSRPGYSLKSDPVFGHGAWSSGGGRGDDPIWIEKPADWPSGGSGLMVVTGTLAERRDVPVFRLDANTDSRFAAGLPVPDGDDLAAVRHRFVIVDVSWELAMNPPAKETEKP